MSHDKGYCCIRQTGVDIRVHWTVRRGREHPAVTSSSQLTCEFVVAGGVELSHVELQANDGEHEDGHEQQQADLQQGDHGLHDGLEHHLQAWRDRAPKKKELKTGRDGFGTAHGTAPGP